MNKVDKTEWTPCPSYCQMTGAATAFLSFKAACVLFNGPRWCAVLAEKELSSAVWGYQQRLFCSQIQEGDLLYGTEQKLIAAINEMAQTKMEIKLLGIITSCSLSLIGDDIAGICRNVIKDYPVLALDAGGLSGNFYTGFQKAMIAILRRFLPGSRTTVIKNRVNLLCGCSIYPNSSGDIAEVKRILQTAGIEVGVCLGEDGCTKEAVEALALAGLNIVIRPEIGLDIAKFLQQEISQNFLVAPIPYGLRGTLRWLKLIGSVLHVEPKQETLAKEIRELDRDIKNEFFDIRYDFYDLCYAQALIFAPHLQALNIKEALLDSVLELERIDIFSEDVDSGNGDINDNVGIKKNNLPKNSLQILLGNEQFRHQIGQYDKTIFLNTCMPGTRIKNVNVTYVGIRGWAQIMTEIAAQTRSLIYALT